MRGGSSELNAGARAGLAGTASPHLCWRAFAEAFPALDDSRRQSTTIDNGLHRHTYVLFHDYIPPLQG